MVIDHLYTIRVLLHINTWSLITYIQYEYFYISTQSLFAKTITLLHFYHYVDRNKNIFAYIYTCSYALYTSVYFIIQNSVLVWDSCVINIWARITL